ncbi:hypothetical protein V6N12_030919 [Hibiscus sabdariffa]|uniref:Uncharacterized protein n=1 Tax=Hibiscus sabdariffa TaxID=183260 RepID=A0ABR2E7X9_9ROSI
MLQEPVILKTHSSKRDETQEAKTQHREHSMATSHARETDQPKQHHITWLSPLYPFRKRLPFWRRGGLAEEAEAWASVTASSSS